MDRLELSMTVGGGRWELPTVDLAHRGRGLLFRRLAAPGTAVEMFPDWFGVESLSAVPDKSPLSRPERILRRFRALSAPGDLDPRSALDFARSHGPLGLCTHGRPAIHRAMCRRLNPEPIAAWAKLAREVDSLVRLAYEVAAGRPGDLQDWVRTGYRTRVQSATDARRRLEETTEKWASYAHIRPRFRWGRPVDYLMPQTGASPLYTQLALEIIQAIAAASHSDRRYYVERAVCSACEQRYTPSRKPRGKRRYCQSQECLATANRLRVNEHRVAQPSRS